MKSKQIFYSIPISPLKQKGLVLFIALIALVVMSLAAVALIRSVDTNTLIAGNVSSKQAATAAADIGVEAAISWLTTTETANTSKNVLTDSSHTFNNTNAAQGYYSNADPALNLFADATWTASSVAPITDTSGNSVRYIIQRMCRTANQPVQNSDCLFSSELEDKNGQDIPLPPKVCQGAGCPKSGQAPVIRITARAIGPKNTVSYVQAFVY